MSTASSTPNTKSTPTLEGQTVLIIGGTSGIGFGVARASLASNASKVIIASSSPHKVSRAIERLRAFLLSDADSNTRAAEKEKERVKGLVIDAKDLPGLAKALSPESIGFINHLVFTSGDKPSGVWGNNIANVDVPQVRDQNIFDVRFWAAVQAGKSVAFTPGGPKTITFTSGVNAFKPLHGAAILAGLSEAVVGMTRGFAVDFAAQGIRVNCVVPGYVWTEAFDTSTEEEREGIKARAANSNLVHRIGEPEDLAEAYLFLMKCGFITGQTLIVDGGYLLA